MNKFRIHYFNGQFEEIETEESLEDIRRRAQPILDVVDLGARDACKEQTAIQVDGGGGEQSSTGEAKENPSSGSEGVRGQNKKRKVVTKES